MRATHSILPLAACLMACAGAAQAQAPRTGQRDEASPYSRYLPDTAATRRAYFARPRTDLERVLNYTNLGNESGAVGQTFFAFWISGYREGHACVLTRFTHDGAGESIDLRRMDPAAFDIRRTEHPWNTRVGVPGMSVALHQEARPERVRALWQQAFRLCPYAAG